MSARRLPNAFLKAGLSATVSLRALIMRLPMDGSFAQLGTRPHFAVRSSRVGGPSSESRAMTIGASLVGAML